MEASPLAVIDRVSARSSFRGRTGSPCGMIGTLFFLAVTMWVNTWIVLSYAEGNYFQSSFETQASGYQTMNSPYDLKMAIVFENKTSGEVANHTLLRSYFDTKMFSSSSLGSNVNVEEASLCISGSTNYTNYFADAVNPFTLKDAFIFTPNKNFLYSYQPTSSPINSQVGFYFGLSCRNAFFCRTGGSALTAVQNNLIAAFTNFSMTFIFSTRVLQPDGSSRHQVYNVSSGEFTNPIAATASFDAQLMISNITMDYSIMPWTDMKYLSNLAFYGLQKATPKAAASIYTPLPRIDTIASDYQNLIFRYYKKEDWLLGVVGGSAFLIYLSLWIVCHCINQSSFRVNAAQQLLLQIKRTQHQNEPSTLQIQNQPSTLQIFQTPSIGYAYYVQRFIPFCRNRSIEAMEAVMDITNIIKQLKIAQRNVIHFVGSDNLYDKYRRLKFDDLAVPNRLPLMNETVIKIQEQEQHSQLGQGQGNESLGQLLPQSHQDHPQNVNQIGEHPPRLLLNQSLPQLGDKKYSQLELLDKQPEIKPQKADQNENENEGDLFEVVQLTLPKKESKKAQQAEKLNEFPENKLNELIKLEDEHANKKESQKGQQEEKMSGKKQKQREGKAQSQNILQEQVQEIPPNEGIIINQQLIKPEPNHQEINRKEAELFGIHPDALSAIKNSENAMKVMGTSLAMMQLTNNTRQYMLLNQNQEYDTEDGTAKQESSKVKLFFTKLVGAFRILDFYSVKISFNADSANHSWFGVLITAIIIALPCIQLANRLQLAGTYQVYVSKDFQQARDISYSVKTGQGFRPALCTNSFANSYLTGYGQTVQPNFYTYTASQGYTYYNPINLPSNAHGQLGITPDSAFSSIDTSLCFVMPDNVTIPMGSYNTSSEAFFGFRMSPYCSGTTSYCSNVSAADDAAFISFLNGQISTFTLYTQLNQYNPSANTVLSGQVYAHNLREGSSNFKANSSIEETLYLDQIQLMDNYAIRFIGDSPVLESTISTSRYQLGEVTKAVTTPRPFYQLRIRPSGISTKIYLVGSTLDVLIGMIGGIFFIAYVVFHTCGKIYNNYNIRNKLASILYEEDCIHYSTLLKLTYLFARPLLKLWCCCTNFSYKVGRMQRVDQRIKRDLDAIEMVKNVSACAQMSLIPYQKLEEKELASVYFKERADAPPKKDKTVQQNHNDFYDEVMEDEEQPAKESGNKIVNVDQLQHETSSHRNTKSKFEDNISDIDLERLLGQQEGVDLVPSTQPYRDESSLQRSKIREILAIFDIFHSDAEFSLRGQWRVRSVFGCLLSLLSVYIILSLFLYYILNFSKGFDRRISYNRGMLLDPSAPAPMQLNTSQNFRAAFGFYTKPGFAFQNLSSVYNSSLVGISVYQYTQMWINSTIVTTENQYDLIPCPIDYFDSYMSPNDDPSYYLSLPNGFCLPYNLSLNLSAELQNGTQYFRVSVYNKSVNGSTLLQNLTSSYSFGIYMTVPIVNLQNTTFGYQVHQLRPNSETLTRAYNVNVTLTRQTITFTNPNYTYGNYTYGQNSTTVSNYNYLQNRAYEVTNQNSATTAARVYNITFAHSGLVESYVVSYSSITELLGYAGGIILVVLFVLGCIAQSFNNYYKECLIARELYLLWPKRKERAEKSEIREERVPLMQTYDRLQLQKINQFNQLHVFAAWLLSFFGRMIGSYDWNANLSQIHKLRTKAVEDIDLFLFCEKLAKIRDTMNSKQQLRLSANPAIPLSSIYHKRLVREVSRFDYERGRPLQSNVIAHQFSSRDQWRLFRAEQSRVQLESVFDREYLDNVLLYKPTPFKFEQRISFIPNQQAVRVRDELSSARSKRKQLVQQWQQPYKQLLPLDSQQLLREGEKSVLSKKQKKSKKNEEEFDQNIQDQSVSEFYD